jgi:hypothetical protein
MINVRKLVAWDIAILGYRFILAEFTAGVVLPVLLGLFILLRSHAFWQVALALYFASLGINYVPLWLYALAIGRRRSASAEVEGELADRTKSGLRYTAQSLLLLVPLLIPVVAVVQELASKTKGLTTR